MADKPIGSVYVNILQDEKGEIKFAYGYEIDDEEIRLNDLAMLNSLLEKWKNKAQEDFNERLEISDKEFSIESKKEGENGDREG